jgi:hypothetical protein
VLKLKENLLALHEIVCLDGPVDEGHGGLGEPAVQPADAAERPNGENRLHASSVLAPKKYHECYARVQIDANSQGAKNPLNRFADLSLSMVVISRK